MGSGVKRKTNDSVIINRPKEPSGVGGSEHTVQQKNEDMNKVCPPTFQVKINPSSPLPDGTSLSVDEGTIFAFGQRVGTITKEQLAMLTRCLTEGFRYSGEIVSDGNVQYAVFRRL